MLIIDLLKQSKELYLQEIEGKDSVKFPGMCWCIKTTAIKGKSRTEQSSKGHPSYIVIQNNIPEFIPSFLGSDIFSKELPPFCVGLSFWWPVEKTQPRIEAFDKLIKLYENSDKEFVW